MRIWYSKPDKQVSVYQVYYKSRIKLILKTNVMTLQEELSETWFDMRQVATILQLTIGKKLIGRNELFKLLRQKRILQEGNNLPYKKYIELEYFTIQKSEVKRVGQYQRESEKTLISLKGIEFIKQLLI